MIIILEGPDGAGKSLLAHTLGIRLEKMGLMTVSSHHTSYPGLKDPSLRYLASLRRDWQHKPNRVVILDRSWLSEPIYGQVLRGGVDRVGLASRRMLERVALKSGAVVVRCYPPYEVCQRNWAQRQADELIQEPAYLKQVYDLYENMITNLPVLTYDYTGPRGQIDHIDEAVIRMRNQVVPMDGIGYWHPTSTLLVGDRVSRYGWPDLPFVSFKRSGCSAWLAERLESWGFPEWRLYWLNAHQQHPEILGWSTAPKKVVALGEKASRWLERAGVEHQVAMHPQAHKRFHFAEEYKSLREALL